ncbi:hypothetical protein ABFX02_02G104800 [Erythranthe guttata]
MDGDNRRRAAQGQAQIPGQVMGGVAAAAAADAGTEASDWKNHLQAGPRQRIVNKITETLKRHLPFSGQEGLQQLKKIAVRFEERVYTEATSQSDYLRKISLKMLTMEIKPMNSTANSRQSSNAPINSKKPQEPDWPVVCVFFTCIVSQHLKPKCEITFSNYQLQWFQINLKYIFMKL